MTPKTLDELEADAQAAQRWHEAFFGNGQTGRQPGESLIHPLTPHPP